VVRDGRVQSAQERAEGTSIEQRGPTETTVNAGDLGLAMNALADLERRVNELAAKTPGGEKR